MKQKVEKDRVLGHEDESDGIQEYDNPLPDWWLGLFWITIIWGVAYLVHYHFIAHRSPEAALAQELAQAEMRYQGAAVEQGESEAALVFSAAAVAEGEGVFQTYCVACHGANMLGGIGPNLLDEEWIHCGTAEDIIRTITDGVPAMGMVPWGPVLGADQVNRVATYVIMKNAEALGRDPNEALRPAEGS